MVTPWVAMILLLRVLTSDPSAIVAASHAITVDANAYLGLVRPDAVGQMMEWAQANRNKAWAEKLRDRSIEGESVLSRRSSLYDAFAGSSLGRSGRP
jgi:hypothetical protein